MYHWHSLYQTRVSTVHKFVVEYFVFPVFVNVFVDRRTGKAKHIFC